MSTEVAVRRRVYPGYDQLVVRGVLLLGALTSIVAAQAAGARPDTWQSMLLVALTVVLAVRPDSSAGAVLLVGLAYLWSTVTEPFSWLVLVAAAGMLVVHGTAQVAAQGPVAMRVDRVQVRRLCARTALLELTAAAVWRLVLVADGLPDGRLVYAVGLTLVLVLAATTTRMISARR